MRYVLASGTHCFNCCGAESTFLDWLRALTPSIGVLHLQNTDFQSDSHRGWPMSAASRRRGLRADVRAAGLQEVPAFLELFDAFEASDDLVLRQTVTSVEHCKRELGVSP